MWRERVAQGVAAGAVAAAAVGGVATGLGARDGEPGGAFTALGRRALSVAAAETRLAPGAALVAGVLVHVAAVLSLGVIFALLCGRLRGVRLWLAALAFAAFLYVTREWLPALLRYGHVAEAPPPQILLHLALAVGLAAGIRLAPLHR